MSVAVAAAASLASEFVSHRRPSVQRARRIPAGAQAAPSFAVAGTTPANLFPAPRIPVTSKHYAYAQLIDHGWTHGDACQLLQLNVFTVYRWRQKLMEAGRLHYGRDNITYEFVAREALRAPSLNAELRALVDAELGQARQQAEARMARQRQPGDPLPSDPNVVYTGWGPLDATPQN